MEGAPKMKIQSRRAWRVLVLRALVAATLAAAGLQAHGQDEAAPAEKPAPITTSDAQIPVDHLKLLVKPLTREELRSRNATFTSIRRLRLRRAVTQPGSNDRVPDGL